MINDKNISVFMLETLTENKSSKMNNETYPNLELVIS